MALSRWLGKKPQAPAYRFDADAYPTVIIPTRNRPTSLSCLLSYIGTFYPGAKLIVADGSMGDFQAENQAVCAQAAARVNVDYRSYSPDLPLLKRLRTVLESVPDGYYVMGADDDFPVLEVLGAAKDFLERNPDFSICSGYNYLINMNRKGDVRTMMFNGRTIDDPDPAQRCRTYADLDFPTYYSVATRAHMLTRYDRLDESCIVGFVDYMLGFHDLLQGKLHTLDAVSYIRTANSAHSYIRVTNRLNFLRDAQGILKLQTEFTRELLAADPDMAEDKAEKMGEDFIFERVRFLTRDRANPDPKTPESEAFFEKIEKGRGPQHDEVAERLDFVKDKLKTILTSEDNKGEDKFRRTVD